MGWSRVQTTGKNNVHAAHSGAASFAALPSVRHQVFVIGWGFIANNVGTPPGSASVSVTDNQSGNVYNVEKQVYQNSTNGMLAFVAELPSVIGASGTFSVTVDVGAANTGSDFSFVCIEMANGLLAGELDEAASGVNTGSVTTADTTATANALSGDELVFTALCIDSGQASITTQAAGTVPASGWTNEAQDLGGASSQCGSAESIITRGAVTPRYVWTYPTGSPCACVLATFPAVAPPTPPATMKRRPKRFDDDGYFNDLDLKQWF